MLHHEYDALKGYRFLGGGISFYSVSCMSDVIFNPSLLNWSSLILTVAHIYIYIHNICMYLDSRCNCCLTFVSKAVFSKDIGLLSPAKICNDENHVFVVQHFGRKELNRE